MLEFSIMCLYLYRSLIFIIIIFYVTYNFITLIFDFIFNIIFKTDLNFIENDMNIICALKKNS